MSGIVHRNAVAAVNDLVNGLASELNLDPPVAHALSPVLQSLNIGKLSGKSERMSCNLMLKVRIQPGRRDDAIAFIGERLKETRKFAGCEFVNLFTIEDEPDTLAFVQSWASMDDYEAYVAWRTESGGIDDLAEFLAGPPELTRFEETGV